MVSNVYKASSPKLKGGAIYLAYKFGQLTEFNVSDAVLTPEQLSYFVRHLPVTEAEIPAAKLGEMVLVALPEKSLKDKMIGFCIAFKDYRGVPYKSTPKEVANLKGVPVNADLLRVFFECPLLDFSATNYVARINRTRDFLKNGRDLSARMPNHFDKDYYRTATGEQLVAYRKHLVALGWVYDSARNLWKEPFKVSQKPSINPQQSP